MAISKITLPDNTTQAIKDSRIAGVDSSPVSGSGNVVTSGGVYTALSGKQATLVSGTNIKTINNTSLLGSGDISIEGGGSGVDSVTTEQDGTIVISLSNGDTVTVDLNHGHPQYPKYHLCTDESEYEAISSPDSDTLYLIPET